MQKWIRRAMLFLLIFATPAWAESQATLVFEGLANGKIQTRQAYRTYPRSQCEAMAPMVALMSINKQQADQPEMKVKRLSPTVYQIQTGGVVGIARWLCE